MSSVLLAPNRPLNGMTALAQNKNLIVWPSGRFVAACKDRVDETGI